MAGLIWKYSKEQISYQTWRITISTTRRRYGGGWAAACYGGGEVPEWWDEDISARYANGPRGGQLVQIYRDCPTASIETILLIGELKEGDLLQIFKDERLCKYVLVVAGEIIQLAADFEPVISDYILKGLSVEWLLAQEYTG